MGQDDKKGRSLGKSVLFGLCLPVIAGVVILWIEYGYFQRKAPSPPADKNVLNVLEQIDLKKCRHEGKWRRDGQALVTSSDDVTAWLVCPVTAATAGEEYTLRVDLERIVGDDAFVVGLILPGGHSCAAVIDAAPGARCLSAIEMVDGTFGLQNPTARTGAVLANFKKSEIACVVRSRAVAVTVDGRIVTQYNGDLKRLALSEGWNVADGKSLFLGCHRSEYRITRVDLVRAAE